MYALIKLNMDFACTCVHLCDFRAHAWLGISLYCRFTQICTNSLCGILYYKSWLSVILLFCRCWITMCQEVRMRLFCPFLFWTCLYWDIRLQEGTMLSMDCKAQWLLLFFNNFYWLFCWQESLTVGCRLLTVTNYLKRERN